METLIDDMGLRHDGRVDALPLCFDSGGNLFMLVLDAERYGCVDLCFADGCTQEPTGLDTEKFPPAHRPGFLRTHTAANSPGRGTCSVKRPCDRKGNGLSARTSNDLSDDGEAPFALRAGRLTEGMGQGVRHVLVAARQGQLVEAASEAVESAGGVPLSLWSSCLGPRRPWWCHSPVR